MKKLLLLLVAACLLVPAGALGRTAPSLQLVSTHPLVIAGSKFRPAERVRVTVTVNESVLRRTTVATRRGVFRADFGDVTFGRCGNFTAKASGSGGSRAFLRRLPLPACMPLRSP